MISIFHPTTCSQTTPFVYMPAATAAYEDFYLISQGFNITKGDMGSLRLQTCPAPSCVNESLPLLIFSPGVGVTRLFYSSTLQWIASLGYTIVSIDHPYDADIVEFLDGTFIYGLPWALGLNNSLLNNSLLPVDQLLAARVNDVSFVIDYLGRDKVGLFGLSGGGVTAAHAILTDKRILGGINMDGVEFGIAINISDSKPFVLLGQEGHNLINPLDPTWGAFWEQLHGPKLLIDIKTTRHHSFTDFPVVLKELNVSVPDDSILVTAPGNGIGTIDGVRILEILRAYVIAIFNHIVKGQPEPILQGPSKGFPEVTIVNSSRWD